MANIGFPLFDLKTTNEYVFIAGGGGSKDYGKDNGVMAIKKSSLRNNAQKPEHFYKTSDFILHIQIYTEKKEEVSNLYSEILLEEAPAMADGYSSSENELTIPFNKDQSSSEELTAEALEAIEEKKEATAPPKVEKKVIERKPSNGIFILAIGDDNLYVLKFNNSFSLHCKVEKRMKHAFLNQHLFMLRNEQVQGLFDTIKNPSSVHFKASKIEENVSDPTEEYVYKLYKKRSEVIPLNEHCTRDIPKDWDGFFVVGSKIHKIKKQGNMNVFVFKNQKYEIPGKMSRVVSYKETLIFYSNTEKEGNLYFIGSEDKVYKLQRLTAIDVYNNYTAVVTLQGNLIIYQDGHYHQRMNISSTPVTGVAIDKSWVYFTELDGQLKFARRVSNLEKVIKAISIGVLLLAILIYLFIRVFK